MRKLRIGLQIVEDQDRRYNHVQISEKARLSQKKPKNLEHKDF